MRTNRRINIHFLLVAVSVLLWLITGPDILYPPLIAAASIELGCNGNDLVIMRAGDEFAPSNGVFRVAGEGPNLPASLDDHGRVTVMGPGSWLDLAIEVHDGVGWTTWQILGDYTCPGMGVDNDHDNVSDDVDNCLDFANADQADADHDGLGDGCDYCPADPYNDTDGDGVCGSVDNCPALSNVFQEDSDGDGIGDICDLCVGDPENDADGDGICGNLDLCPGLANVDQRDTDGDGLGDSCDSCPYDANNDVDGDGICGEIDNCPGIANPEQMDSDSDLTGDRCDLCPDDAENDHDGDGVCGRVDNCPHVSNVMQEDADGDGLGDVCDVCPSRLSGADCGVMPATGSTNSLEKPHSRAEPAVFCFRTIDAVQALTALDRPAGLHLQVGCRWGRASLYPLSDNIRLAPVVE